MPDSRRWNISYPRKFTGVAVAACGFFVACAGFGLGNWTVVAVGVAPSGSGTSASSGVSPGSESQAHSAAIVHVKASAFSGLRTSTSALDGRRAHASTNRDGQAEQAQGPASHTIER